MRVALYSEVVEFREWRESKEEVSGVSWGLVVVDILGVLLLFFGEVRFGGDVWLWL